MATEHIIKIIEEEMKESDFTNNTFSLKLGEAKK